METKNNYIWHLTAVVVVGIWGLTFISTRVLIESGLTPQEIFLLRFLIAYIGIWFISPRKLLCNTWRDEGWMLLAGVTGGSLYFLTENTALEVTLTTNVAFIVCSTPLLTLLLYRLFFRSEKATWKLTAGSLLALLGVGLVIFNGNFVLKLSPLGDLLSLSAALCWAFYSLIMKQVADRYSSVFITRKVFFYGLLTILPAFLLRPWQFPLSSFAQPAVWMNLLFLSVLASLVCFVVWNIILKRLGTVLASNYIYLNPIFTSMGALFFLDEPLTPFALMGATCVLLGVYLAGKK
ncbi:DMT family transporter [uncultured Bacteroides sp.]|uniref:DMT family transporter n=1 Tax=uncultured Bacteroides sp. TaxID=162156 RepID=UPI0026332B07|nr:DMT family transporter [uncultured Bacteroides sp.]